MMDLLIGAHTTTVPVQDKHGVHGGRKAKRNGTLPLLRRLVGCLGLHIGITIGTDELFQPRRNDLVGAAENVNLVPQG